MAQDAAGNVFHARNLDFGLFLGWDKQNKTWSLAEKLRPLLFNAHFIRGGVTLYNSTVFAGYVGLLTGMKQGQFSISVDTRFDDNLDRGLLAWLRGDHSHKVGSSGLEACCPTCGANFETNNSFCPSRRVR